MNDPELAGPAFIAHQAAPLRTTDPAVGPTAVDAETPGLDPELVRRKIRGFLSRAVGGRQLGDAEDLFELGLAHSLFVMQIAIFIEREFAIELEPDDIDRDELSSVSRIAALVSRSARV